MTLEDQMELFSFAYVRAVAAVAGFGADQPYPDRKGIDLVIHSDFDFHELTPQVEIQVKCHKMLPLEGDSFVFNLPKPNYDKLRGRAVYPRLLVVVAVPHDITEWLTESEEQLSLSRCGYYLSLAGMGPATQASEKSRVPLQIPRAQRFTVEAVRSWMRAAAKKYDEPGDSP